MSEQKTIWVDASDVDGMRTVLVRDVTGFFELEQFGKKSYLIQLNYVYTISVSKDDFSRIKGMLVH